MRHVPVLLALPLLAAAAIAQCASPPPGLVAWWPLDEPSGVVAEELVAGRYGVHASGPLPVPGRVDGALHLSGYQTGSHVSISSAPVFNFGLVQDFTLMAWVRVQPEPLPVEQPILTKMNPGPTDFPYGWYLLVYDGHLGFRMRKETSQLPFSSTDALCDGQTPGCFRLDDQQWHHVAVTLDRDRSPDGGTLYADGQALVSFDPTTLTGSPDNPDPVRIGHYVCYCVPGWPTFRGDVDEVAIFARELTAAEVQAAHAVGSSGWCKLPCSIQAPAPLSVVQGVVPVVLDAGSWNGAAVTLTFEGSVNQGGSWWPATPAPGSPLPGPAPGIPTPSAGLTFEWDSAADLVGLAGPTPVRFRVTSSDGLRASTCQVDLLVDNQTSCAGVCGDCDGDGTGGVITDALVAAQIAAGVSTTTLSRAACCDVDRSGAVTVLDALRLAQTSAQLPVVLTCP